MKILSHVVIQKRKQSNYTISKIIQNIIWIQIPPDCPNVYSYEF